MVSRGKEKQKNAKNVDIDSKISQIIALFS